MLSMGECVRSVCALTLALVAGFASGAQAAPTTSSAVSPTAELPYEEVARQFADWLGSTHGAGKRPRPTELIRVLGEDFLRVDLGLFEARVPHRALETEENALSFLRAGVALIEAQSRWSAWSDPAGGAKSPLARDLETIRDWLGGLSPDSLSGANHSELLELVDADAEVRAAAQRAAGALRGGGAPVRLALMPTRAQFVELLCFAAWVRPELRANLWVAGIENWMHFFVDELQVYALEYATSGGGSDYSAGVAMDSRSKTALEQHIVALASTKLLDRAYGTHLPVSFVSGLSNNLVIDLYGEVDTRVDGDLSDRQAQAREVFVPGGNPNGGILPPNDADSSWRADQGKHHFARVLRQAQKSAAKAKKAGGRKSPRKTHNFLLRDAGGRGRWVVAAPFLGAAAAGAEVPTSSFQGDYVEFLRAYQIAFVYWLRTEAAGSKKKSITAFGELLGKLESSDHGGFVEVLESVYDEPLSDEEAGKKSLEGRFLRWLSKQRSS